MSKAFTSDDAREEPVLIPPRAALPAGVPNYVTPRGLKLLRAELSEMEGERARVTAAAGDEIERRHRLAVLAGRLAELTARIASAVVVDARDQPRGEVRFGATVTLHITAESRPEEERRFKIVGVDEADPRRGRVAFVAPIARAVLGCQPGDTASLRTGRGEELLEVVSVEYESDD